MLFAVALLSYLSYTNLVFHKSAKWDLKPQPGHHCQLRSVCWKVPFQGWGLGSVLTTLPPQAKRVAQGLCIAGGLELTSWQRLLSREGPLSLLLQVIRCPHSKNRKRGKRRQCWDAAVHSDGEPHPCSGLHYNGKDKKTPIRHPRCRYSAHSKRQV